MRNSAVFHKDGAACHLNGYISNTSYTYMDKYLTYPIEISQIRDYS